MFVTNKRPFVWCFGPVVLLPGANEVHKSLAEYLATDESFSNACKDGFVEVHGAENASPETFRELSGKSIDELPEEVAIQIVEGMLSPKEANEVKKKAKNPKIREKAASQLDHILNGEKQI